MLDGWDFAAYDDVEACLRHHGFTVGAMHDHDPIGVMLGPCFPISFFANLTAVERAALHGTITIAADSPQQSYRWGTLIVDIKDEYITPDLRDALLAMGHEYVVKELAVPSTPSPRDER